LGHNAKAKKKDCAGDQGIEIQFPAGATELFTSRKASRPTFGPFHPTVQWVGK